MQNHSDSDSRNAADGGLLGASARWLATQSKLLASGFAHSRSPDQTLESFDALGVGLEVWSVEGQRLFSNRTNAVLLNGGYPVSNSKLFIDSTQNANGQWHQNAGKPALDGHKPHPDVLSQFDRGTPHLQELPGNRWLRVYGARSAAGYIAVARVEVTDMVRSRQELEDRVRKLLRDSATDGLTGLANRRHFDAVFTTEWNRATRSQTSIALLMVDIDHFKRYNDHYGHQAGDRCLQQVAATLESCVRRAGEFVARYGGEEFVLLLPGASDEDACETAQKCLDRMREAALEHAASPTADGVTLSIGVASIQPLPASESMSILNAADAAMYRAKSAGRNRYALANEADWNIADGAPRTLPGAL